jgi:hypothetical protein
LRYKFVGAAAGDE